MFDEGRAQELASSGVEQMSSVTLTMVEGCILHRMGLGSYGNFGLEIEHFLAKRDMLKQLERRLSPQAK